MNNKYKKYVSYLIYVLIVPLLFALMVFLGQFKVIESFVFHVEQSSFDFRQRIISMYKISDNKINIIAVDDASYEYIMDKYGSWPISRKLWSDILNFIEKANPRYIAFDMLFLKPNLYDIKSDYLFADTVKKYGNIFLSINFDDYNERIRKSPVLNNSIKLNIIDEENQKYKFHNYINARTIMKPLENSTNNIGVVNVTRDDDGIIRTIDPVFKYKNDFYPSLSLKVAMNMFGLDKLELINNQIIMDNEHFIPLYNNSAVLNWYGRRHTYSHIPLWEIIEAKENNDFSYISNLKDKILFIGTTATSLSDIKSVPTDYKIAGVELHTTFLNNILDNNFIKKVSPEINFIIAFLISFMVGYCVLKMSSVFKTIIFLSVTLFFYCALSIFLMTVWNLWIDLVVPLLSITIVFILAYCEKYILKSKDYEQTYALAVTDGLTQLYNHRYFQEQMINCVNLYNRYKTPFSLIMIDIDFFKKFNDSYGHQSGDCVLKQVANIIKKNSRTSDIACRYGGEEMTLILTNTSKKEAVLTANKICAAVRNNEFLLVNNKKVNVTISVGVATVEEDGDKPSEIIEYSDKCLYKAKQSGRDQVVFSID